MSAEGTSEITPLTRQWPQLVSTGVMWVTTNACVAFIDAKWLPVWGFITTSVLVVVTLGGLYATQRLADIQRQLIAAYKDEATITEELVETLKQQAHAANSLASSYRRAFVYAKKVGEGMDRKQAGIEAGREGQS